MQDLVLHLGFPKTGTTTLQEQLFAWNSSTGSPTVLGMHPDGLSSTSNDHLRLRRHLHGLRPRSIPPRVRWPAVRPGLGTRLLFTDEATISRALHHAIASDDRGTDRLDRMLRRIRAIVPPGARLHLLVTTRTQDLLVPSLLAQGYFLLPQSRRTVEAVLPRIEDTSSLLARMLDYQWVSEHMQHVLGALSITYLPLELLEEDPSRYWALVGEVLRLPRDTVATAAEAGRANVRRVSQSEWETSTSRLASIAYRLSFAFPLPLPPEVLKRRIRFPSGPRTTPDSPRITVTAEQRRRILAIHGERYRALLASVGCAWVPSGLD